MTSLAADLRPRRVAPPAWDGRSLPYRIEETRWGLRVRSRAADHRLLRLLRAARVALGTAAATAGLALLLPLLGGDPAWALRLQLGVAILGGGLVVVWMPGRQAPVMTELDTLRGEVRTVVLNPLGLPRLVAVHGLDAVRGVALDRTLGRCGLSVLTLRLADGSAVAVAGGADGALAPLRRRLERDLMTGSHRISPAEPGPLPRAA